jgi:hypothetical protein
MCPAKDKQAESDFSCPIEANLLLARLTKSTSMN